LYVYFPVAAALVNDYIPVAVVRLLPVDLLSERLLPEAVGGTALHQLVTATTVYGYTD